MSASDRPFRRYRFGVFEVDFRLGHLSKAGLRLKVAGQPLQILERLLQRPGDVVTREELRSELWPGDTFVDFEHNLNSAVKRLRAALGDSAETPRFIETLPRRGYRFLAPVEVVTGPAPATPSPGEPTREGPLLEEGLAPVSDSVTNTSQRRWSRLIVSLGAVALLLSALAILWGRSGSADARSVVVLPFLAGNTAEGSDDDYVAFGMTDALIGELSHFSALKVISQTSAMQYQGVRKALPVIARELGVGTVVEGSVVHEGGQVRITFQLVDALTDTHLWTRTYSRDPSAALSTQRALAREVAGLIRSRLVPSDQSSVPALQQTSPVAYEAYLKGRYFMQKPGEASLTRAREFFEEAIAADERFAPAHVELASYFIMTDTLAPADAMPRARASALRALELDPSSAAAHTSLAIVHYFADWDWAAAERAFARAIELDPSDARTRRWHALYLSSMGRHATAAEEIQRAIELDPVSASQFDAAGAVWSNARRFDKVLEMAGRIRDLNADDPRAFMHLAVGQLHLGRYAEAILAVEQGVQVSERNPAFLCILAVAQHRAGQIEAARQTMAELDQLAAKGYVPDAFLAVAYLWLRDHDTAVDQLQRALARRDGYLVVANVAPWFDPLREHPGFQALLESMRFPS